jgi:hypothetical protein
MTDHDDSLGHDTPLYKKEGDEDGAAFAGAPPRAEGPTQHVSAEWRRCSAMKRDGTPCTAYAVRGEEAALCAGHRGLGNLDPVKAGRASAENRNKRAEARLERREKALRDLMADELQAHASVVVKRLLAIVEKGSDSDSIRAAESLLNRVYGRARETVEVSSVPSWASEALDQIRSLPADQILSRYRNSEES